MHHNHDPWSPTAGLAGHPGTLSLGACRGCCFHSLPEQQASAGLDPTKVENLGHPHAHANGLIVNQVQQRTLPHSKHSAAWQASTTLFKKVSGLQAGRHFHGGHGGQVQVLFRLGHQRGLPHHVRLLLQRLHRPGKSLPMC